MKTTTSIIACKGRFAARKRWDRTRACFTAARDFTNRFTATTWATIGARTAPGTLTTMSGRCGRFSFSVGAREEVFDVQGIEIQSVCDRRSVAEAGLEAESERQPRFPAAQLHRPRLHDQPIPYHILETLICSRRRLGATRAVCCGIREGAIRRRLRSSSGAIVTTSTGWRLRQAPFRRAIPSRQKTLRGLNFTGAEASFGVRVRRQRFDVAYTRVYGAQSVLSGLVSEYVFNYPSNDAVMSWQGMLPGKFVARSRIGVVQRYARDPYALWDASVGREFKNLSAHLAFANLTNTGYQEIPGVAMPGRSIMFGMDVFVEEKALMAAGIGHPRSFRQAARTRPRCDTRRYSGHLPGMGAPRFRGSCRGHPPRLRRYESWT